MSLNFGPVFARLPLRYTLADGEALRTAAPAHNVVGRSIDGASFELVEIDQVLVGVNRWAVGFARSNFPGGGGHPPPRPPHRHGRGPLLRPPHLPRRGGRVRLPASLPDPGPGNDRHRPRFGRRMNGAAAQAREVYADALDRAREAS